MHLKNRSLVAASLMLGAAMTSTVFSVASAQTEDSFEAEEALENVEEPEACAEGEDCAEAPAEAVEGGVDEDVAPETEADAVVAPEPAAAAPEAEAQAEAPAEAQGGAVPLTPGSTDESNPGGSTRPGTRPD